MLRVRTRLSFLLGIQFSLLRVIGITDWIRRDSLERISRVHKVEQSFSVQCPFIVSQVLFDLTPSHQGTEVPFVYSEFSTN